MVDPKINWAPHDEYTENSLSCRCGAVFRSHCKYVVGLGLVSRKPCPGCGGTQSIWKASSDPETMTIGS